MDPRPAPDGLIDLGHVLLDLAACCVHRDGEALHLTQLETRLLRYLLDARGAVVSSSELLVRVWGYDQRVESKAAALLISRLRRKIERDPSEPTTLITAHGHGFRLALPAAPSRLIGRAEDARRLIELLAAPAARVALHAPAGAGKSSLLGELAQRRGWLHIPLQQIADPASALTAVLGALGVTTRPPTPESALAALAELHDQTLLLDGVDALPEGGALLASALHAASASTRLLVARRAPWELEGWRSVGLSPLTDADGAALLRASIEALTAPDPAPPGPYEATAALLHNNPLLIDAAARRAAVIGVEALHRSLAAAPEVAPQGHGLLRYLHDTTWARLDEPARRILRAAAWPEGPCPLADLLDVARRAGWQEIDERAVLRASQAHLLQRQPDGELIVPSPLDAMVREQEPPDSELTRAYVAHAAAIATGLARGLWTHAHGATLAEIGRRASLLRRAAACAGPDDAVRIGLALAELEVATQPGSPTDSLLAAARAAADPELRLLGAQAAARQLHLSGAPRQALAACDEALEAPLAPGAARAARARVMMLRGTLLVALGRPEEGIAVLRGLLADTLAPHEHWLRGNTMSRLGLALTRRGDPEEAHELYLDALRAYDRCGASTLAAGARHNLGALLYDELQPEAALELLVQAERELYDAGEQLAATQCGRARAVVLQAIGSSGEAWGMIQAVLDRACARGWRLGELRARVTLARLLDERGDHAAAHAELRRARRLARACALPAEHEAATVELAWSHHRLGQVEDAIALYREAPTSPLGSLLLARALGPTDEGRALDLRARTSLRASPKRLACLADDAWWPRLVDRSWEARCLRALDRPT
jgi:tetratricopeptide (TPR) repeat protein/DNA-binding winged helix-turn-helix (wHTH) protein